MSVWDNLALFSSSLPHSILYNLDLEQWIDRWTWESEEPALYLLQSPCSLKLSWYSNNKKKVNISCPKSMNFLPCLDASEEHLQVKCSLAMFKYPYNSITWLTLQPLLQYHSIISKCTDVKETCQHLEVKSQNITTYHAESNIIKTGIQVWRNKRSWTPQRLGQGSLVRRLSSQLWYVRMSRKVLHLSLWMFHQLNPLAVFPESMSIIVP